MPEQFESALQHKVRSEKKYSELMNIHDSSDSQSDNSKGNGKSTLPEKCPNDLISPQLSENAVRVLKKRYLKKDNKGNVLETPSDLFWRVARFIADNEIRYDQKVDALVMARKFYNMMANLDFMPNSPTLMNAGRELGQLAACFVLPVEDSMEGIFEAVKNAALVHKSGGGTGFSFSRIRPKSAPVNTTGGVASGPISFMTVFNAATETIKQGGTRRGANMGILRVDHPDIRSFITCKSDMVSITNFNISVAITDKFMKAVENGDEYDLVQPNSKKAVKRENAREIFDLIAENTWLNGDPGMIFIDEINRHEKTPHLGAVEATNPCGEQPLLPYESCNLGSINLNNMLTDDNEIDWDKLRKTVRLGIRFLDNIVDLNKFPIEEIKKMTQGNRRIGLGLMGFADMLYALDIPYDSEEAVNTGREAMKFIHAEARKMSDELAQKRGPFPNWVGSAFDYPTRNSTVTTIAPTGTISMICDTSGGIEPNFALVYVKRVMDDDRLLYINNRLEEKAKNQGWYSKELMEQINEGAHLSELDEIPDEIARVFVTSHDIPPEWHIRMQAAFQEYTDNAVSKTINFPNSATIYDIKSAYLLAWKLKCKGITVYRDGSRDVQVMNVGNKLAEKLEKEKEKMSLAAEAEQNAESLKTSIKQDLNTEQTASVPPKTQVADRSPRPNLKPRQRPKITRGYTEQIVTGEGSLYITINEDEYGLCEVFASIGKSGGNAYAQSEAIGRLISLALRAGVDPRAIVKQLKGITSSNPVWYEGELIRSTPDAIGRALERALKYKETRQSELPLDNGKSETKEKSEVQSQEKPKTKFTYFYGQQVREQCPDCQGPLIFEEGCMVCKNCGFSKCE